eukprot:CAMPEP_0174715066 /NCGR_PEP_ID=MMETSP1094-20130205/20081_1 /TAXON_ID=156173 /ORGANISM="Chrysochromulina brevifilum, Strain UTEX LB 985" /LENGTH=159 /DNA_ID=CAMNT_0015914575 /DNA_START=72 /DNA_END=551 /DNA_ORIENTATION=+
MRAFLLLLPFAISAAPVRDSSSATHVPSAVTDTTSKMKAFLPASAAVTGQGLFVSSFNGDVMEVIDTEMSIFHKGSIERIGHVENAVAPFFYGSFPWGIVKMVWDGKAWQESGSPNVQGFLANARWEPMVHDANTGASSFDWLGWEPGSLATNDSTGSV